MFFFGENLFQCFEVGWATLNMNSYFFCYLCRYVLVMLYAVYYVALMSCLGEIINKYMPAMLKDSDYVCGSCGTPYHVYIIM